MYLSIIVPCYNMEQYLKECVDSILAQTFEDFELILVDDGSTDATASMCDAYSRKDKRIKVIHQKNGGLVCARKSGLKIAQGKYACYVDADDFVLPTMYQVLCGHAKITEADIVMCDFFCSGEQYRQDVTNRFEDGFYNKADLEKKIYPHMICDGPYFRPGLRAAIWSKIYKRELLQKEQMLVDNKVRIGEDSALVYPILLLAKNLYYAKGQFLYGYRVREKSMSHALKKPFRSEEVIVLGNHLKNRFKEYAKYQEMVDTQRYYYNVLIMDMMITPHIGFRDLFLSKQFEQEIKQYRQSEVGQETINFAKDHVTSSRMRRVMEYIDALSFRKKCALYLFKLYEMITTKMRKR